VCYVQASDHLAYSALLAAVFMSQTVAAGITSPRGAVAEAFLPMATEILLGFFAIELVNFLTGAERGVELDLGKQPLLPVRKDWPNRSLMLTALSLTTVLVAAWLGLPAGTTAVSALILGVTPGLAALRQKGLLRGLGVFAGLAYSLACAFLLARATSFYLF